MTDSKTATDNLREILDARGVECEGICDQGGDVMCGYCESYNKYKRNCLDQKTWAIYNSGNNHYINNASKSGLIKPINYCPNCGRKLGGDAS